MLHSDDADINAVISEIISLDHKAVAIKNKVSARAEAMLKQTITEINKREQLEIETAQQLAQKNYASEIKKAEQERLDIINAMDRELLKLRYRYDEKKDEKAIEVLDKLFKNPGE